MGNAMHVLSVRTRIGDLISLGYSYPLATSPGSQYH